MESSYDLAPAANQLVVGGDSCNNGFFGLQALFNADTAILNGVGGHPLAQIASNSWEGFDETQPVNIVNIEHAYLVRAAAEGVSMLFSAGDGSGVLTPSSDPFATAVGGTTLGIGNKVARLFETGWSTGIAIDVNNKWIFEGEQGASGGGPSLLWAQPGYQRGVVPAWLAKAPGNRPGAIRAVPDISADADPFTGMNVGLLTFDSKGNPNGFILERHRRHQPRLPAGRGHGGRRRAEPAPLVRVPQPGALPAGRDERHPRHAADHVQDAGALPRRRVRRGHLRRAVAHDVRRRELQHAVLHRPGDPHGLRHHDRHRHPGGPELRLRPPQAGLIS